MRQRLFNWLVLPFLDAAIRPLIERYLRENSLTTYQCWGDESRLKIDPTAQVNNAVFNLSSGNVIIEDHVFFGTFVNLLTGTHNYRKFDRERAIDVATEGRDIIIKRGAWIASNAIIIGPCVIGEHAVVSAGSVVRKDVAPYTVVAGVPAVAIKVIEADSQITVE